MTFSLSFAAEFYHAPGEPHDGPTLNSEEQPVSLYSAIALETDRMTREDVDGLAELAALVPGTSPQAEDFVNRLVELARRTDTCSDLESPVEVWIDPKGDFRVLVYDVDG